MASRAGPQQLAVDLHAITDFGRGRRSPGLDHGLALRLTVGRATGDVLEDARAFLPRRIDRTDDPLPHALHRPLMLLHLGLQGVVVAGWGSAAEARHRVGRAVARATRAGKPGRARRRLAQARRRAESLGLVAKRRHVRLPRLRIVADVDLVHEIRADFRDGLQLSHHDGVADLGHGIEVFKHAPLQVFAGRRRGRRRRWLRAARAGQREATERESTKGEDPTYERHVELLPTTATNRAQNLRFDAQILRVLSSGDGGRERDMKWTVGMALNPERLGALRFAAWLGRNAIESTSVRGVHVMIAPRHGYALALDLRPADRVAALAESSAQALLERAEATEAFESTSVATAPSVTEGLSAVASEGATDCLIVGRRVESQRRLSPRLGSDTRRLLRRLPAPVAVVPCTLRDRDIGGGPVLLATDLSTTSDAAGRFALRLAKTLGRDVHTVHVAPPSEDYGPMYLPEALKPGAEANYDRACRDELEGWAQRVGIREGRGEVVYGDPVEEVLEIGRRVDAVAIVAGSRGMSVVERVFGHSIASDLAASADRPTIVVPDDRAEQDDAAAEQPAAAAPSPAPAPTPAPAAASAPATVALVVEHMSAPAITVNVNATTRHAVGIMQREGIRHLPVVSRGKIVGMLSDRDLLPLREPVGELMSGSPLDARVSEVMTRGLIAVSEMDTLIGAINQMLEHNVGAVAVLSRDGETVRGVVSAVDVLRAAKRVL